jgi:hypothetical protein
MFETIEDLRFGRIVEVAGTSVRVELDSSVVELTRNYQGRVYAVGQLGSLVKIHMGRRLVFGFVTLLRMRSEEEPADEASAGYVASDDQRVMDVELFAEGGWDASNEVLTFRRGVQRYPLPKQGVYLLTKEEGEALFQAAERRQSSDARHLVEFGSYVGGMGSPCRMDVDRTFGTHAAILGSTGAGKSSAVAALIHSLLEHVPVDGGAVEPTIVLVDPHGEYTEAFGDRARVYRAYDPLGGHLGEYEPVRLPYWLMSGDEFRQLVIGKTEHEATSQHNIVYKALTHARMVAAGLAVPAPREYGVRPRSDGLEFDEPQVAEGADTNLFQSFDRDRPRPFSLEEFEAHIRYLQGAKANNQGATEKLAPGKFNEAFGSILDKLAVLRRDPRIQFMMSEWLAGEDLSLSSIIGQFVGNRENADGSTAPLRIIDISGLPNEVAGPLCASVARILFYYKMYQTEAEKLRDPTVLVCEEAHRYVPQEGEAQYAAAQSSIRRIAREGRKYGLGLLLVSQRPADVEGTVMAQCATWLILRLSNAADQEHVKRFLPDSFRGMTSVLPGLGQREGLFVGEGAALPCRVRVRELAPEKLPRSTSVPFMDGWLRSRLSEDELELVAGRMDGSGMVGTT